jgi:hypothetical protein
MGFELPQWRKNLVCFTFDRNGGIVMQELLSTVLAGFKV